MPPPRGGGMERSQRPQVELVYLANQLGAKAVMGLLRDEPESPRKIYLARGGQWMICPEHHSFVARTACEGNAFIHQPAAQVMTAGGRIHQQDSQLCGSRIGRDAEHTARPAAIELGDP